ncbi:MAG: peptidase, partial [Actinobacteria bacterium]|nr:peptidase [Actinomycetota bacterium]
MRRHLTAASLLAALVVPAPSALAAAPDQPLSAAGSIGVRLVGAPAGSRDALGRSYIIERVAPGATMRRRVEISNDTRSTAEVAVYAAAAGLRRGRFEF